LVYTLRTIVYLISNVLSEQGDLKMKSLADRAIAWQDDHLVLLDQRILPNEIEYIHCNNAQDVIKKSSRI